VGKLHLEGLEPCCGQEVALLGSAVNRSRGYVQVRLGRCLRCEQWRWATTTKLDRPWANGMQAGMYLTHLRAEVLAQLF
jgi:hypothetical protein